MNKGLRLKGVAQEYIGDSVGNIALMNKGLRPSVSVTKRRNSL